MQKNKVSEVSEQAEKGHKVKWISTKDKIRSEYVRVYLYAIDICHESICA
jgi:hypothetical protein